MLKKLLELRAKRAAAVDKLSEMVKAAETENRDLNEDETKQYDTLFAEVGEMRKREARLELIVDQEKEDAKDAGAGSDELRDKGDSGGSGVTVNLPMFDYLGQQMRAIVINTRTAEANTGGVVVDPRLLNVRKRYEHELRATGMSESVPAEGGWLVQKEFNQELMDKKHQEGKLRSKCDIQKVGPGKNGWKANFVKESSRAAGSRYGGIRSYYEKEAGTISATKLNVMPIEVQLQKLTGLLYTTDEQLEDTVALDGWVKRSFGKEFGFREDDSIFRGNGTGMPLGILAAPALVTVDKEVGQVADTIVSDNIFKMYARMWPGSLANAEWYINQDCWPQLFKLSVAVGTGGVPVFMPAGGISSAPFGSLLGRPVFPIEQSSTVGTVGDISFVDLKEYLFIEKTTGIQSDMSIHVQFVTAETCFRFIIRHNGQPYWEDPLTPYQGSDTVSPFIVLASR